MRAILISLLALAAALQARSQGRFNFSNVSPSTGGHSARIGTRSAVGEGSPGDYLGSNYTASLSYLVGSGFTKAQFDAGSPTLFAQADATFDGMTGPDEGRVGAGFPGPGYFNFNGGTTSLPRARPRNDHGRNTSLVQHRREQLL